jgi:8-oxo-dGTP pyrophosphatase MutT (NUDIX family)
VVVRTSEGGERQVALVHRPGRADWSLPKGKLELGETPEDAALREVHEETGLLCRLGSFAGTTSYVDSAGRPKVVDYWVMEPFDGEFAPGSEVDEMSWTGYEAALARLTYPRDRELLASLVGVFGHPTP